MTAPLILLIGLPGSGKSTWAARFRTDNPGYLLVSTDSLRAEIYGDEAIQGSWPTVWSVVQQRWRYGLVGIQQGSLKGVIYDATNVRRRYRRQVLTAARESGFAPLLAYWFDVPLDVCLTRNSLRSRQVPEAVLHRMDRYLQAAPPALEDGLDALCRSLGVSFSADEICDEPYEKTNHPIRPPKYSSSYFPSP